MPISPNPTITIYFKGLLAFCFGEEFKYCQIGFHTRANGHEVKVSIYKKRGNRIVSAIPMLRFSHEMIRRSSDLWLDVEGETPPKQQTATPYIVNDQGATLIDDQDFRHVVDLEGENFYNRPLKMKDGVLTPSLFIGKGIFYAAALTAHGYKTVLADSTVNDQHHHADPTTGANSMGQVSGRRIGRIATYVGANIYLDGASQVVVLRAGGKEGAELFRLNREEDTTYELTIENYDTQPPAGSDFGYYYSAIELNPGEPKILIEPNGGMTGGDCDVGWFSKSHRLGGNG
jgi:hypothetical protein